jgi:hypothetical protein
VADWHPIMAAVEGPPAVWRLVDPHGREYGLVELRRVTGGELRYKVSMRGEVLGWSTTLRDGCRHAHAVFLAAHGPTGGARADWGELTGHARQRPRTAS